MSVIKVMSALFVKEHARLSLDPNKVGQKFYKLDLTVDARDVVNWAEADDGRRAHVGYNIVRAVMEDMVGNGIDLVAKTQADAEILVGATDEDGRVMCRVVGNKKKATVGYEFLGGIEAEVGPCADDRKFLSVAVHFPQSEPLGRELSEAVKNYGRTHPVLEYV